MKRLRGPDRRDGPFRRSDAQPTDPGAAAARARVATLLEAMTRVELQVVVVSPPDETRLLAEDRARDAALVAGRDTLLRDAVEAAREATIRLFARGGYSGTWAFTDWSISVATAADRAAAAAAFEEAAMAAVVEDLVDDETVQILRSTSDELAHLTGMPRPGSLSGLAMPAVGAVDGPIRFALAAVFVVLCIGVGLFAPRGSGLILLALGVAVLAGLVRRHRRPGR